MEINFFLVRMRKFLRLFMTGWEGAAERHRPPARRGRRLHGMRWIARRLRYMRITS